MPFVFRPRRAPQPRNNGSTNIARSAFDTLLPVAVRHYTNAISVDGYPVTYYRRRSTGMRCTCCGTTPEPAQTPDQLAVGANVLKPSGEGTPDYIASMLHGSVFQISRYGSRNRMVDANGGDNPQRSVPHSPLHQSANDRNKSSEMSDPFVEQLDPGEPDDLFVDPAEDLSRAQTNGCAVCLGTGWVGGYDPFNAMRVVYDTQAQWSGSIVLDNSVQPYRWTVQSIGQSRAASITVLVPAGAVGVDAVRVWNNRDLVGAVRVTVSTSKGAASLVDAVRGGLTGWLLVNLEFADEVEHFTHLEVQFALALDTIYADWGRLSYSEDLSVPEHLDNASLIISPNVPAVSMYDVVSESVYRRLWKINTTNPLLDRERQVHGWEATARLIQAYELPSLLPRQHNRVWFNSTQIMQQPRQAQNETLIEAASPNSSTSRR